MKRDACRVVAAVLAAAVILCCAGRACAAPVDVLLLGDGDADPQVQQALEDAGHTVVFGGLTHEWDGITPNVNVFDVVVCLYGYSYATPMQPAADAALADFVANGGGLVVTEWIAYAANAGWVAPGLAAMLPVTYEDYDYGATWEVIDPNHPLAAWLRPHWHDGAEFCFVTVNSNATVIAQRSDGNAMLTFWDDPGGPVVHVNHSLTYDTPIINPFSMDVLVTAAEFAGGMEPEDCDSNGTPDYVELADGDATDINDNRMIDACEDCNANGIPDEIDIDALMIAPTAYEFAGVVDLDWIDAEDDSFSPAALLPFPVALGGETFVRFQQSSNGYVELLRDGEDPYEYGYGTVDGLINYTGGGGPTHTFLMAAFDDLTSSYYGYFGHRTEADRIVFYWNTETYCDGGSNLLNEFEIVLYDDGTADWNFNTATFSCYSNDLYSGLYLGYASQSLMEIAGGTIPAQQSWRHAGGGGFQSIPFAFTTETNPLDWQDSADEGTSGPVPLPNPITIGAETYVAFAQNSNGYVELLRAGETPYPTVYGYVGDLINNNGGGGGPNHSYLMAAFDDLSSDYHGFYGYRIETGRIVFFWLTETYCDSDNGWLNSFEIILFDDGTVQWSFDFVSYVCFGYDLFTGVYLGHGEQILHEAFAGYMPMEQSFLFDADGALGGGSLDLNGNGIPDECETACPADVNGDGVVNVLDLLAVLAVWGATGGPEDINGDGIVNVLDLLEVLAVWGPC